MANQRIISLHASAARTATGNGTKTDTPNPAKSYSNGAKLAYARARGLLNVTAASGTTPTLDVVIEDTIDDGTTYHVIGTFAQKTATGKESIAIAGPIGPKVRARYTITGTTPSFTFTVDLIAEE